MARREYQPPMKFIAAHRSYGYLRTVGNEQGYETEKGATDAAAKFINDERRGQAKVGVYQLIAVVKAKSVPVEVEKISTCKEKKE